MTNRIAQTETNIWAACLAEIRAKVMCWEFKNSLKNGQFLFMERAERSLPYKNSVFLIPVGQSAWVIFHLMVYTPYIVRLHQSHATEDSPFVRR